MSAVIGILAAGASSRMRGRDKLLEEIDGTPLLARQVGAALQLGLPVVVALPPEAGARHALLAGTGAMALPVEGAAEGMSASIAALAAEAERRQADHLVLLLADMPEIGGTDIAALLAEARRHPGAIVRAAAADGRPGHPVVFPSRDFSRLRRLAGDRGARDVLASAPDIRLVRLGGQRAVTDLDTPEEWQAWRAARAESDGEAW